MTTRYLLLGIVDPERRSVVGARMREGAFSVLQTLKRTMEVSEVEEESDD